MSALPPALLYLIKNLGGLPGIGEKTATRLALAIMRWPDKKVMELSESIREVKVKIRFCSICFSFSEVDPCPVCADPRRMPDIVCVVEDPGDMMAVEKSGGFKGLYHVLHGLIAPMDGVGPDQLKIKELISRVEENSIKELILATSPTVAGEATAAYLAELLKGYDVSITRIACGIPMGMDLKYSDDMTLKKAIEGRNKTR